MKPCRPEDPSSGGRTPLLSIKNLEVSFETMDGPIRAVRGLSLDLYPGEILGIVGETGSGKSVSCKAITQLLPKSSRIKGSALFQGVDLLKLSPRQIRPFRGDAISMIFQDPQSCLNPIKTIYSHLKEVIGKGGNQHNLKQNAEQQLAAMQIHSPKKRLKDYPFQFSGGMAQRVQIAMAIWGKPDILIADEPTTALDVTVQAKILNDLKTLSKKNKMAIILVTHDLGVVAEICDRIAVMYHGRIVELGETGQTLSCPEHPYTRALLASIPVIGQAKFPLKTIQGESLAANMEISGCAFAPRCCHVREKCRSTTPLLRKGVAHFTRCLFPLPEMKKLSKQRTIGGGEKNTPAVLCVKNLTCRFKLDHESGEKQFFSAVNNVSFSIKKGEIFGIVGESGSGKSTLAKSVMGLSPPFSGSIHFNNQPLFSKEWNFKTYAAKVQYVFQDPLGALDPRMPIISQVMEPLEIHGNLGKAEKIKKAKETLAQCGLNHSLIHRKPYNLSGGQRQRAVLARALINNPEFLICDEPVSAMDVSVQAQILNLLKRLAHEKNMTVLIISHDLSVMNNMCDRIGVMLAGQMVEQGPVEDIFHAPTHPYTQLLMDSIPQIKYDRKIKAVNPMGSNGGTQDELLFNVG